MWNEFSFPSQFAVVFWAQDRLSENSQIRYGGKLIQGG
jgi:hypothetical protein